MHVRRVVPDFHARHPTAGREFYREVLGLEVAMDHGWIVTIAAPGSAAHAAARRLGCEIVHPLTDEPWGVRRFFVREPNGKVLNILSHP